jgi:hypothetical protein
MGQKNARRCEWMFFYWNDFGYAIVLTADYRPATPEAGPHWHRQEKVAVLVGELLAGCGLAAIPLSCPDCTT